MNSVYLSVEFSTFRHHRGEDLLSGKLSILSSIIHVHTEEKAKLAVQSATSKLNSRTLIGRETGCGGKRCTSNMASALTGVIRREQELSTS